MRTAAADLLHELTHRGVTLIPAGEHIRVKPRDLLTDDDRERIRACKPDLLALLASGAPGSNEIQVRLLMWGGTLGWPSLVEVGLGAGGESWTEWLMAATLDDLKRAVLAAVKAEHTTLALDVEALTLWPGSGIVREEGCEP